jgi:hypothetical protein
MADDPDMYTTEGRLAFYCSLVSLTEAQGDIDHWRGLVEQMIQEDARNMIEDLQELTPEP